MDIQPYIECYHAASVNRRFLAALIFYCNIVDAGRFTC